MSRLTGVLAALFLLFLWAGDSGARCWVWTTSVNFGNYDVFSTSPADSTGTIFVFCNQTTFVTGSIGPSPNSGGFNPRQMKLTAGTDLMDYNLFRNPARTEIWGDGSGGTFTVSGTVPRWIIINRPVYGRIPSGQDVSAGLYTDTLTVTLTW